MDQGWAIVLAGCVAIIPGTISAVMSIRTRTAVRRVGHDTALVKEQVKNSHPKNLRVESDERHDALMGELTGIRKTQTEQGEDIRGLRIDVRRLSNDQTQDRDRIRDLEKTTPRRRSHGNENDDQH